MRESFRNYLIPNEENEYKPHALQQASMAVMFVLVLLTFALANLQSLLWLNSDWLVSTVLPAVVVDLTNEERSAESLALLNRSALLDEAAQLKAEDMATNGYFAHYSPDGASPWDWFNAVGYNFASAGENLAVHFTDSADVVEAWMNSKSHRENVLGEEYTEIGVGTARGEYEGYPTVFVVQMFGLPAGTLVQAGLPVATAEVAEDTDLLVEEQVTQSEPETDIVAEVAAAQRSESSQEIFSVSEEERGVVVTSHIATTAQNVVQVVSENQTSGTIAPTIGLVERAVTQPHLWLQLVYGVLALFVISALALSIVIEWRRQHPVQIVYGAGLLAVMAVLFYVHTFVTNTTLVV